jgi:outer membrane protein assembly factor BamB
LPDQLKLLWSEKLGSSRLTQATAAYGMVFTSEAKSHQVFARDAASGKTLWSFVADGRVDFAPTLHKGLCLFGTGAGSVYALDAKTGNEVWRMRAAPTEKYIAEEGQFASTWPVIGGIMPLNGELYFSCGRAAGVEGGIKMFAVDAATGKIRWRVKGGTSGDFFLSDGSDLYMTKVFYQTATGSRTSGKKSASGLLRTTEYFSPVSIADYMACVEPALTTKKHVDLTDGRIAGENLAFNDNLGIASWRYRFGVPADIMKKDKGDQRFIYAKAGGKVLWLQDEIKPQIMGVVLAGDTAYMTGAPAATDSPEKSELWVLAGANGKQLQTLPLPGRPAYDGLSASNGRLYVSGEDGVLSCFGAN